MLAAAACSLGAAAAAAIQPAGEVGSSSFSRLISSFATDADTPEEALNVARLEPGSHLTRVTRAVARAAVVLATTGYEYAPTGYWLAVGMVAIVVIVFLLLWCALP